MRVTKRASTRSVGGWLIEGIVLVAMAGAASLVAPIAGSAAAWYAGVRSAPTPTQQRQNGIDFRVSTHQWATNAAVDILAADVRLAIVKFLAQPDPTAPIAVHPTAGSALAQPENYRWRFLVGSSDADGVLYPQMRDHLHNFWTHRGRQWIVGGSAASNAERAFSKALSFWRSGDKSNAVYWLGASVHLVQDACVPQHNFFGVGVYHSDYERWVLNHQDQLVATRGGIYQSDFRRTTGHGGADWNSSHPRGWVDECAHRSARELRSASHAYPKHSTPTDPQWRTAAHVAAMQQLSAGYIAFFFEEVHGP